MLAAAILCRVGPVLEALRLGGTVPQVNPTTPPRWQREPSRSTVGDNKRQSLRLKAGQQALAGLTLGSRPVSASDNPEVRTPTQPAGRTVELRGETLPLQPWARHCMEISDRPTTADHARPKSLRQGYVPQTAPPQDGLRDGGGKPSLAMGAKICVLTLPWGDKLQESLSLGDGSHPFPEDLLEDIREILAPGAGRPAGPTLLPGHLAQPGAEHSGPHHQFPRDLEQGVPLKITDPPLALPGIWPLKKELKGRSRSSIIPQAGVTTPQRITSVSSSVAHSWRRSPWAW